MNDGTIVLADGRTLAYSDIGDHDGVPVVHFHGTPSSRLEMSYFDATFASLGIRMVVLDRPGYGLSSAQPNRALADGPADAAALADALGIDRFVVSERETRRLADRLEQVTVRIHRMRLSEHAVYVHRPEATPPVPAWKRSEVFRDELPERDRVGDEDDGGAR